jgi:hypothetical protein
MSTTGQKSPLAILHLAPKVTTALTLRVSLGLLTAQTLQAAYPTPGRLVWSTGHKPNTATTLIVNPHFKEPAPCHSTK